jgi:hypothetical protein
MSETLQHSVWQKTVEADSHLNGERRPRSRAEMVRAGATMAMWVGAGAFIASLVPVVGQFLVVEAIGGAVGAFVGWRLA